MTEPPPEGSGATRGPRCKPLRALGISAMDAISGARIGPVLRPEGTEVLRTEVPCCVRLAGGSPAAVSAGAPRSRPRVRGEISGSERGVESRQGVVGLL